MKNKPKQNTGNISTGGCFVTFLFVLSLIWFVISFIFFDIVVIFFSFLWLTIVFWVMIFMSIRRQQKGDLTFTPWWWWYC